MNNFTLCMRIINFCGNTLLLLFIFLQLPVYLVIFWGEFIYLIILMCIRIYKGKNFRSIQSVTLRFPAHFSILVFIKIYIYTPRYTAFYVLDNIVNLNKKKFKFKNIIIFIFIRIWTCVTCIPLFIFNLWKFWKIIIKHAWLYYDSLKFGLDFILAHQNVFK